MHLNSYLSFNGQCEAAFKFYEQSLGGKILSMFTHAGMPGQEQVPPEWRDKIMHARLAVGDDVLMGSDVPPDRYKATEGIFVNIAIKEPQEAERVFHALAENGTVQMPIQQTFWAERFGTLVDQYGIPWMVNCEGAVKYE